MHCLWQQNIYNGIAKQISALLTITQHCRRHEKEMMECVLSAEDRDALFAVSPDGELSPYLWF